MFCCNQFGKETWLERLKLEKSLTGQYFVKKWCGGLKNQMHSPPLKKLSKKAIESLLTPKCNTNALVMGTLYSGMLYVDLESGVRINSRFWNRYMHYVQYENYSNKSK